VTEEEVKVQIVLPWLMSLGVPVGDLRLETRFSLTIGTRTIGVSPLSSASGRLDILVRRGKHNLLVVETKSPANELTDSDRDQAVSYARLVHPIAPYALVTNGVDFRLYDSLTKESVESGALAHDGLSIALPDSARREALQLFLAASPTNLLALSRIWLAEETATLSGSPEDLGAVYVQRLHVGRSAVDASIRAFMSGTHRGFALVGHAGMGKSSSMIDIANRLSGDGYSVLFFRGIALEGSLKEAVSREVAWAFGDAEHTVRALARLVAHGGKPLVVMVDGLEDWEYTSRAQELAWLIGHSVQADLRFIVSCSTGRWLDFLKPKGVRLGLERHIFGATAQAPYSANLGPMNDDEFHRAVHTYRHVFDVHSGIEADAIAHARRSPFFLRLLFQIAATDASPTVTLRSQQFFDKYLELVTRRTGRPATAQATLTAIAQLMALEGKESIDELAVRQALALSGNEDLAQDVFDDRTVVAGGAPGRQRFAFSFGQLRSYLIAFHVRRWPELSDAALLDELSRGHSNGIVAEAWTLYYDCASLEHCKLIDEPLRQNAKAYLHTYLELIAKHFPELRARFQPRTAGKVGFIAEINVPDRTLGYYGFRPIGDLESEVIFVAADASLGPQRRRIHHQYGVRHMHWSQSSNGFVTLDVRQEVIRHEILPQLKEMIERRLLNESGTDDMLSEQLIALRASLAEARRYQDISTVGPPVATLDEAIAEARRLALWAHFDAELSDEEGSQPASHNSTRPPWRRSDAERLEIDRRIAECSDVEPKRLRIRLVDVERIRHRLGVIRYEVAGPVSIGMTSITPLPDGIERRVLTETDRLQVSSRSKEILERALRDYRRVVAHNFPTLNELSWEPFNVVINIEWGRTLRECDMTIYWCASPDGEDHVRASTTTEIEFSANQWVVEADGQQFLCRSYQSGGLDDFVRGRHLYSRPDSYHLDDVVRPLVYEWVRTEFNSIATVLGHRLAAS
jgi:hypothetical protein